MTTKSRDSRSLLADDSGATMVMGIFMAMMVVGMIYYVWGIGGTIVFRERMQDAADAGAFGASVYDAAGMNMIAFMNVLMAICGVIGAAARLVQDFASITIPGSALECAICVLSIIGDIFGGCQAPDECGGIEGQEPVDDVMDPIMSGVAQAMDGINEVVHFAQMGVSLAAFSGGEALAVDATNYNPNPIDTLGIMVPGNVLSNPLQIQSENDTTTWACSRGSFPNYEFIGTPAFILSQTVMFAYEPPNIPWVAGRVYAGFQTVDRANHYCNNGNLTFQRVPTDAWLGDQSFQNYLVDYRNADPPYTWTQHGVEAANWGHADTAGVLGPIGSMAAELQHLSFADSEYYYEASEDSSDFNGADDHDSPGITLIPDPTDRGRHQEWLFHPFWRARMRRFHVNTTILGRLGHSVISEVEGVIVH